jgi:hypothetical protein
MISRQISTKLKGMKSEDGAQIVQQNFEDIKMMSIIEEEICPILESYASSIIDQQ